MSLPISEDSSTPCCLPRLEGVLILLAGGLLLAATLTAEPLLSGNDSSRWCTVWSLVERGTYMIDAAVSDPAWDTIDKVRHDGHFYSTKPALLPTLVAGLYWCIRHTLGWNLDDHLLATSRLILVILNLIPYLIGLSLIGRITRRELHSPFARGFVMATAALGSTLSCFLVTFNNHTVAATGLMLALYFVWRILWDQQAGRATYAAAGFFSAWTCTNELPAAAWGVAAFLILSWKDSRRTWTAFVPAALVPLAGFFLTTWVSTGGWKPFYMYYGTPKYEYYDLGIPSYWMTPRDIDSSTESTPVYLMHCLIGHHGLFSLTPVLLLSALGTIQSFRRPAGPPISATRSAVNVLIRTGGLLSLVVLCFYLTRTSNYNYGGKAVALRWMMWLTPFWVLSLIPVLQSIERSRVWRGLALLLLAGSAFSVAAGFPNPWRHPWLLQWMTGAGWVQYETPPDEFERPPTCVFGSLPQVTDEQEPWAEFTSRSITGEQLTLKLTVRRAAASTPDGWTPVDIEWTTPGGGPAADVGGPRTMQVLLNAAALQSSGSVEQYLRLPDDLDKETVRAMRSLFQGVPSRPDKKVAYLRYLTRYVFSPLREEAFTCRRTGTQWTGTGPIGTVPTAAAGSSSEDESHPATTYRCDVWFSDDVPFGTLQFQRTTYDAASGEIVARELWKLKAASHVHDWQPPENSSSKP